MLKGFILAAAVLHGADAATTNAVLAHPGYKEAGLASVVFATPRPSPAQIWAFQSAGAASSAIMQWKLAKRHPRLAWTAVVTELAVEGICVGVNARNLQRIH
jgi:hypothetical protein